MKPTGGPLLLAFHTLGCDSTSVGRRSWTRNRLFLAQLDTDLCAGPAGLFDLAHVEEFTSEESVLVLWEPSLEFQKKLFRGWEGFYVCEGEVLIEYPDKIIIEILRKKKPKTNS